MSVSVWHLAPDLTVMRYLSVVAVIFKTLTLIIRLKSIAKATPRYLK